MLRTAACLVVLACVAGVAGCANTATRSSSDGALANTSTPKASDAPSSNGQSATSTPEEGQLYTPTYIPNGNETAVIKTNKGSIKVRLFGRDAPVNVGNFIELAMGGYYDDLKFHRLEPGFVIQGGDPQTKKLSSESVVKMVAAQKAGAYSPGDPILGTGGPGYTIKGEFDPAHVPHAHVDGTLAMARANDPNSAGSQFYFTLGPQQFLDGKYTVFGQAVEGLDVVHTLGVGDVIESITIENVAK